MDEQRFSETTESDANMSMSTSETHESQGRSAKDPESNNLRSTLPVSDKFVTPHMPGLGDTADQYRDAHIPTFDNVKKALAFLVAQNAQLRVEGGSTEEESLSDGFHNRLQGILTNDICDTFAEHMQGIQKQTESLPPTGVEGPQGSPAITDIPKAPWAMLRSERRDSQNPTPPRLHTLSAAPIPILFPSKHSHASILDNNQTNATAPVSARPATAEIAIPLDPQFLFTFKSTEREEGEISSSSITSAPSKTSSADSMRRNSTTDESYRPRRSSGTEPPRHRLPSSRTYRCSRSPEARRRRWSPSRRSSGSSRRSPSPGYTKRSYSPDRRYNRRSPSPRADRLYRRAPRSPATRSPRPLEPKPMPSAPRRSSSEYDASLSKPSHYEPLRANTLPDLGSPNGAHKTRYLQRPDHERSISIETTSSDYRRSNHERRNRKERESDVELSRRSPNQLVSSTSKEASHRYEGQNGGRMRTRTPTKDTVMKERTPTPTSDVSMRECLSQPAQEQDSMEGSSLPKPESPMQITKMSCHTIPGLWMIKSGLETVEILSCEFEIDKIIAERWGVRRSSSRHGKEKEHDPLSLKLACVPLSDLEAVQTRLGKSVANPEEVVNAVGRLETVWPSPGHLVIELNPDRDWGRSWLPRHLGEDQGAIEIIDHVHEGTNVIRFIQLAGLNSFTFLVVARIKPPDFYCLEPESTIVLNGGGGQEVEDSWTDDRLLKDFLTSIQITYP